ncbi:MAG: hypothetical protein ACLR2G_11185 [Phascolarctobacterium faecium]
MQIRWAGWDKLNATYATAVMIAKQTVANLLRVPIHYYVLKTGVRLLMLSI